MKKTTILGGAIAVALSFAATGAMAEDKCGLSNGKKPAANQSKSALLSVKLALKTSRRLLVLRRLISIA